MVSLFFVLTLLKVKIIIMIIFFYIISILILYLGFDYRGWYCIEVRPDPYNRPIDLFVSEYAVKGTFHLYIYF